MGANLLRRYIDPTIYSTSKNAFDLISNTVRQSLIYNAYEGKTIFNAVVLTTPVVLSELDLNYRGPVASSGADRISRFVFKGRIMSEPGMPTPHEFLPDPCALDIGASDLTTAMEIISLHTTFVSSTQQEIDSAGDYTKPKVGDKVRVELQGNVFSYNLQVGTFLEVVTDSTISGRRGTDDAGEVINVEDRSRSECIVLSDLFDKQEERCKDDYRDCLDNMDFSGEAVNIVYGEGGAAAGGGITPFFPLLLETGEFTYIPATGRLSSPYLTSRPPPKGGGAARPHLGIDIANSSHPTGIYAIAEGKVKYIKKYPNGKCGTNGGGTWIEITHSGLTNIQKTRYFHIHKVHPGLKEGQVVYAGQNIGIMGTTGCSTGVHLHFEVYNSSGKSVDPIQSLGWKGLEPINSKFKKCYVYRNMGATFVLNTGDQSALLPTVDNYCQLPTSGAGVADYKKHAR
tara:strand:+ start:1991 stop:3358 length:1368 start_codon:yes stop_codon:yes gene_type:complete